MEIAITIATLMTVSFGLGVKVGFYLGRVTYIRKGF